MNQMPAQPTNPGPSPAKRALREFAIVIAALHLAAIGLYYGLGIPARPERVQRWYGWGWMALTIAVVFVGLQRVKRARRKGEGGRRR
jgi:hypothetical protein